MALVELYPLDVSLSRRHDWWRAMGRSGTWLIPDWVQVAADFDAVHLTVSAYLSTAGRALSVGDAATALVGWNPDQSFWLTDILTSDGLTTEWELEQGYGSSWSPAG